MLLAGLLSACDAGSVVPGAKDPADLKAPDNGLCRNLDAEAVESGTDNTEPVACTKAHTAETFYVGDFDADATKDTEADDPALAKEVATKCGGQFRKFTGATESLALRTVVSWAWWRPSDDAWEQGARWYRCDVIARSTSSESHRCPHREGAAPRHPRRDVDGVRRRGQPWLMRLVWRARRSTRGAL